MKNLDHEIIGDRVFIKSKNSFIKIDLAKVNYIQADRNYSYIFTKEKKYIIVCTCSAFRFCIANLGNNASAVILAPHVANKMLEKRYGKATYSAYSRAVEGTERKASEYNDLVLKGEAKPIYKFGKNVVDGSELTITSDAIKIPGYAHSIDITAPDRFGDML